MNNKNNWKKAVFAALAGMSRTLGGVSDTSSSADKPKLRVEGDTLARQTTENLEQALEFLWSNQDRKFTSVAEVREFIDLLAEKVSEGLLPVGQSFYRTWETKFGQTPVAEIETEYQNFCKWLFGAFAINPVEVAALVEKRLDGKIHPFADGCGRTSKLLASFILFQGNRFPPRYSDRREYYREINKSEREWVSYYRSLFPSHAA